MSSPTIAALFGQRVVIGVGDMSASNNSAITLSTYALGSCVALAAYDPVMRVGGLLHVMLPESSITPAKALTQPAMFVDTGVPALMRALIGFKAEPRRLRVFLAGGASVLTNVDNFKIGERNIRAMTAHVTQLGLNVTHTALGGTINRTVHLNIANGAVTLKTPEANDSLSLAA
jgi:chemotaxis protein CheD